MKEDKDAVLLELIQQYDTIRTKHSALTEEKDNLSEQIKARIGTRLEVPVDGYRVSYKYDADKEVTSFDEDKMKTKAPADYKLWQKACEKIKELTKKYTKTETKSGARRLLITQLEA
jgi:hypothetical protein